MAEIKLTKNQIIAAMTLAAEKCTVLEFEITQYQVVTELPTVESVQIELDALTRKLVNLVFYQNLRDTLKSFL